MWLNKSIYCYICNFSIPGMHSLVGTECLHQILLWNGQSLWTFLKCWKWTWFDLWHGMLMNFCIISCTECLGFYKAFFFIWVGDWVLLSWITDVLLWCQTYWSFQTIYWLISLFLHLVTLIYLLLCTYFCCTLVHRSYTTGHAALSTSLLKYKCGRKNSPVLNLFASQIGNFFLPYPV